MEMISRPLRMTESENRKALQLSEEHQRRAADRARNAEARLAKAEAKRERRRIRNLRIYA